MEINVNEYEILLEKFSKEIDNLQNIYDRIDIKAKLLNGNDPTWKGRAQKAAYTYYESINKNFPESINKFKDYKKFLEKTLTNYVNSDKDINESIEKNDSSLTVNS